MKTFLNIVVEIEGEEEEVVAKAKDILRSVALPDEAKTTLTRDGDRSGGNLLLPRLEGRMGVHYQHKKVLIKEVI